MSDLELAFERWLQRTTRSGIASARVLIEQGEDSDEQEDDGDDEKSSDKLDIDVDELVGTEGGDGGEEAGAKAEMRGGKQVATAAQREVPPPDVDDLSLELIVDKLNAIRSGESFKDEDVRSRLAQYFQELTSVQRLALFAFLEGIAEMVATDVSGEDARAPDDPDMRVDMSRYDTEQHREEEESDDAKRVRKPATKEYSGGIGLGSPPVGGDSGDDAPVMVVRR